jgi:hypothetical protein
MSDTEIWGRCGHEWLDFAAWVTGDLDDREERAVEAQFAACDTCWDELDETITVSAVLYEAAGGAAVAAESGLCRRATPAGLPRLMS